MLNISIEVDFTWIRLSLMEKRSFLKNIIKYVKEKPNSNSEAVKTNVGKFKNILSIIRIIRT